MGTDATKKLRLPSDADHTGRDLGEAEMERLREVIGSGVLIRTKGKATKAFEARFAGLLGTPFCKTTNSGTAAVHTAIAAVDPEPGDEIITTPITDMGAITAILYQAAVPVFCDVDPASLNVTAETIRPRVTERTRAIVVTPLFGVPCDMDPILALASERGIPVIEDAAQALLATYRGRVVGTIGAVGCFSLQQGKHITTGEGGMVVSADAALARRMSLFIDKAWGYDDPAPDHEFLALNYRMSELQGAVALAQVEKLPGIVEKRRRTAARFRANLAALPGVSFQTAPEGADPVYWRVALLVDPGVVRGGVDEVARRLKDVEIPAAPRYIKKPAFDCRIIREQRTFGKSGFPFTAARGGRGITYDPAEFPGTYTALERVLVLPWNEFYTDELVDEIAERLTRVVRALV
jgi:dTDP-4-amino-4,6-dideoxygalactose transaminase